MKAIISMAVVAMVVTLLFIAGFKAKATSDTEPPYGGHFDLSVVGIPQGNSAVSFSENGRLLHSLYVPLDGKMAITLLSGTEYAVIDPYGAEGSNAVFSLPVDSSKTSGVSTYSVWIRAYDEQIVSLPGDSCTYIDSEMYCSTHKVLIVRKDAKHSSTNVTSQLLYVFADPDFDGTEELYPLFDADLQNLFWKYGKDGLKTASFRFYLE